MDKCWKGKKRIHNCTKGKKYIKMAAALVAPTTRVPLRWFVVFETAAYPTG